MFDRISDYCTLRKKSDYCTHLISCLYPAPCNIISLSYLNHQTNPMSFNDGAYSNHIQERQVSFQLNIFGFPIVDSLAAYISINNGRKKEAISWVSNCLSLMSIFIEIH